MTAVLLLGFVTLMLAGVPVVVNTRHGVSSSTGARYDETYFRAVLPWTDKVIYVSLDSERYYTGAGIVPPRQGVTIWNGIDLNCFPYAGPSAGGPAVMVGRLSPEKDVATLVRAVARAIGEDPAFRLGIAGDGPSRSELERIAAELAFDAHAPRDPPHGRMVKQQRLDDMLKGVDEIVVTTNVRELVDENRVRLPGRQSGQRADRQQDDGPPPPDDARNVDGVSVHDAYKLPHSKSCSQRLGLRLPRGRNRRERGAMETSHTPPADKQA